MRLYFLILFVSFSLVSNPSRAGVFDRVEAAMDKGDFERAEKLVRKSLEKKELTAGVQYYLSRLYLEKENPSYQVDSAHVFIEAAISTFQNADEPTQALLKEEGIRMEILQRQYVRVAQVAFDLVLSNLSVTLLNQFIQDYKGSELVNTASDIRDSLAFDLAKAENSWQSFEQYVKTYSSSRYLKQAKDQYELLLYKDQTKDQKLDSYARFWKAYPQSPYRRDAEQQIFNKSTANGDSRSFYQYLKNYPRSELAVKAADILYTQSVAAEALDLVQIMGMHPRKDSLFRMHDINVQPLAPYYSQDKYGFMDLAGKELLPAKYPEIPKNYICGNISDVWLQVYQNDALQLISRKGDLLISGVKKARQIGGYIWIVETGRPYVYHSSGFRISDVSVDDALLLRNGWIACRHDYLWGIVSITGKVIVDFKYESIEENGPFLSLKTKEGFVLSTHDQLAKGLPKDIRKYEDFDVIGDTLIQAFEGEIEVLFDDQMQAVIPSADHQIFPAGYLWYTKSASGYQLFDDVFHPLRAFQQAKINGGWLAISENTKWDILSLANDTLSRPQVDSVKLLSDDVLFYMVEKSRRLLFQNNREVELRDESITLLESADGKSKFIVLAGSKTNRVISMWGRELFQASGSELKLLSDSVFSLTRAGKIGVIDRNGKEVIPPAYETIDNSGELIYLLKSGKIGVYDQQREVLIPAQYESRIQLLGNNYLVQKLGKAGVINRNNKVVVATEYDQILEWTDTTFWVRKSDIWSLIGLDGKILLTDILSVRQWQIRDDHELWYVILSKDGHGLWSNKNGELLPLQYNDIINIGSGELPLLFAEQYLKLANFYVVTYFDANGKPLRSDAYRPAEYEKIYCDQ